MSAQDHYAVLNVRPTASVEQIKTSYHRLVLRYHPDKNLGSAADATAKTRQVRRILNSLSHFLDLIATSSPTKGRNNAVLTKPISSSPLGESSAILYFAAPTMRADVRSQQRQESHRQNNKNTTATAMHSKTDPRGAGTVDERLHRTPEAKINHKGTSAPPVSKMSHWQISQNGFCCACAYGYATQQYCYSFFVTALLWHATGGWIVRCFG